MRLGDPAGLVNGFVEYGGYALHTKNDSPAWVRIDLQAIHRLGEIRLYSRGDGFLDERGAQVAVELSEDGRTYRRAGACDGLFSQLSPCVVDARRASARYVQVTHRSLLVLSEIEVAEAR